jgi:hypothetical protein
MPAGTMLTYADTSPLREAGAEGYILCNSVIIDDTSFACEG